MHKDLEWYPIVRYHKYRELYEVHLRLSWPWIFKIVGTLEEVKSSIENIIKRNNTK